MSTISFLKENDQVMYIYEELLSEPPADNLCDVLWFPLNAEIGQLLLIDFIFQNQVDFKSNDSDFQIFAQKTDDKCMSFAKVLCNQLYI